MAHQRPRSRRLQQSPTVSFNRWHGIACLLVVVAFALTIAGFVSSKSVNSASKQLAYLQQPKITNNGNYQGYPGNRIAEGNRRYQYESSGNEGDIAVAAERLEKAKLKRIVRFGIAIACGLLSIAVFMHGNPARTPQRKRDATA